MFNQQRLSFGIRVLSDTFTERWQKGRLQNVAGNAQLEFPPKVTFWEDPRVIYIKHAAKQQCLIILYYDLLIQS